jgi:hypothetical protein
VVVVVQAHTIMDIVILIMVALVEIRMVEMDCVVVHILVLIVGREELKQGVVRELQDIQQEP